MWVLDIIYLKIKSIAIHKTDDVKYFLAKSKIRRATCLSLTKTMLNLIEDRYQVRQPSITEEAVVSSGITFHD